MSDFNRFTEGPWRVDRGGDGLIRVVTVNEPMGHPIQVAMPYHVDRDGDGKDESQTIANARLIAAAPDMYAALKELEAHHIKLNASIGRDESHSTTLRIIRAALAKAGAE